MRKPPSDNTIPILRKQCAEYHLSQGFFPRAGGYVIPFFPFSVYTGNNPVLRLFHCHSQQFLALYSERGVLIQRCRMGNPLIGAPVFLRGTGVRMVMGGVLNRDEGVHNHSLPFFSRSFSLSPFLSLSLLFLATVPTMIFSHYVLIGAVISP